MPKTVKKVAFPPQLPRKKRVAAYARVSSGKDAMHNSLSAQVSYYNALIQKEDSWEFAGVYSDEAFTGTKESRPGFQSLLEECKSGQIDMVITKSISRFARNTVTLLETVRMLKGLNVDVFFEEQNIHTMSADGELMLTILASYAQEESRSASENQKWRVKKNFEAGKPWRCYMLGYRLHDGQYYIVDEEAEVVRRIFREYLDGAGFKLIARGLNEDNIPTMNGGEWHHRTIATILQNYTYTGNLLLQKTYKENYITKKKMMNTGQQPRYLVEKAHEAIIPLEQWQAVQDEIKRRRDSMRASYSSKVTFLYTGLIQCAKCGKNYRRKTTSSRVVWCCATYNTKGKKYCNSKQIPETVLDSLMEQITDEPSAVVRIIAADNNTIHFHFSDGTVITRTWKYNSRAESWTPEKREAARQKTYERNKNNGKSSHDNTGNQG